MSNNKKNNEKNQNSAVTDAYSIDEPWYRSFSAILAFSWPMFASLGAVLSYFQLWQYIKLDFISKLGTSVEIYGIGFAGGVISGIIGAAASYFMAEKQPQPAAAKPATAEATASDLNQKLKIEGWRKRISSGAYIGAQVGSLIGFLIAAFTLPQIKALPIYNTVLNAILYGVGCFTGGVVGLACYPVVSWLNRHLGQFKIYRKLVALLDSSNTANPATERLNAGLELGYYAGVVIGAIVGSAVPGLGTIIGMGLGGALGGIGGAVVGYFSEGILHYFKGPNAAQKIVNNPWSARLQTGSLVGILGGLILNAVFPGVGLILGAAIGATVGATLATILPPFYRQYIAAPSYNRYEEKTKQKLDYPWSTRAYLGSVIFCVAGAAVGFGVGGPAGAILGAGIGGLAGGFAGMVFTPPLQRRAKAVLSYLPLVGRYFAENKTPETIEAASAHKPEMQKEEAASTVLPVNAQKVTSIESAGYEAKVAAYKGQREMNRQVWARRNGVAGILEKAEQSAPAVIGTMRPN